MVPRLSSVWAQQSAVFLCVPVLGELHYGAHASSRVGSNLAKLDELAKAVAVLPCDGKTAASYGEVKFALKKKGRPIPGERRMDRIDCASA